MTDYSIWGAGSGPGASSADNPVNLATEFSVSSTAWLKAIRFWRADTGITGPVQGRVWQAIDGTSGTAVSGTDVTFSLSGTGWQQANLAVPVQLTAGTKYKAACLFPSGYSATANYWSSGAGSAGITNGILTAPSKANSVGGDTQGCFAYGGALAYPANGSGNGGNYWVDVIVTDVDPGGSENRVVLDLISETDTVQPVPPVRVTPVPLVTEADNSQPVTPVRLATLALMAETDTAHQVVPAKAVQLGQAAELDTVLPLTAAKSVLLGLAIEQDALLPITVGGSLIVPGVHTATSTVARLGATNTVARLEAR